MKAWEEFLAKQEKELGKPIVDKWLIPLKVVKFDALNIYLEAPDSFKAMWFEEHIRPRVQTALFNPNQKPIKVHLSVSAQSKPPPKQRKRGSSSAFSAPIFELKFDELDAEATFESFVTSPATLLAHKLLSETSLEITPSFNPIYLFGRSGSGKSHLLMATTAHLRQQGKKVIYVRADTFTEHVVGAIRSGEMQQFRKAYRNTDALIIDGVEILSRKGATQEELFHTFNTLHIDNKLIILGADCSPQELKHVEPRLVSRFEWGIVVPLQMLEQEQMEEVIHNKSQKIGFPLDKSVISFLLNTFGGNTQSLIRAFDALVLRTHLNQGLGHAPEFPLSVAAAEKYLSDLIEKEEQVIVTPGRIIRTVAEHFGIRIEDILSKSQARESALPRQIAMHLCRDKLNLPFMKIGDIFSRDHSTVMASVKQIQKGIEEKSSELSCSLNAIMKSLD